MSFQAYLDTIKQKTGKGPEDFRALAAAKGLGAPGVKAGDVLAWLKQDFDLGHGHAMAVYALLKQDGGPRRSVEERIGKLFSGAKARWRPDFDALVAQAGTYGPDVSVGPTDSYASLLRGGKKFAIVQPGAGRLDLGFKRQGAPATDRFEDAGAWNSMVTHRVRITASTELDAEVLGWLRLAYDAAG